MNADWEVREGHVLDVLQEMPSESVQIVCTSPPYWGLRAYKTEPQVWGNGHECAHEWGEDVIPTERHGSWDGNNKNADGSPRSSRVNGQAYNAAHATCAQCGAWRGELGSEPTIELYVEHIVSVFREVRRVLRKDGTLWLNVGDSYAGSGRGPQGQGESKSIGQSYWSNPENREGLPLRAHYTGSGGLHRQRLESVAIGNAWAPATDGLAQKQLCLIPFRLALALQADGWWVRSDICWAKKAPMPESVRDRPTSAWEHVFLLSKSARYFYDADAVREPWAEASLGRFETTFTGGQKGNGFATRDDYNAHDPNPLGRNLWNYWRLGPEPLSEPHYAAFPTEIPKRAILAGSREGDLVLDPFVGSGTTILQALRLGRRAIGLELSPSYVEMARRRIIGDAPLWNTQ